MKKLGWFDKIILFLNSIFAIILLLGYLLPFIPPSSFALISVLSLSVPLFIFINLAFMLFWMIRLKKQFLLSFIVLLFGYNHVTSIYKFSDEDEPEEGTTLSLLSYNVKQFNEYGWSDLKDIPLLINDFIKEHDPGIVSIQEYFRGEHAVAKNFPHKYIEYKQKNAEFGLAILSKYPIINSGSLDFPSQSNNNGIYADVVVEKDTLRIINVHLQSFSEKPDLSKLEEERSKKVFLGMGKTFVLQQRQVELILGLVKETPYKVIIMGDFNNTAYSYIYRELITAGFEDAYKEEGTGFGKSFDFNYYPLRIDFMFVQESIEIKSFKTFEVPYSDHFPIQTTINLNPAAD